MRSCSDGCDRERGAEECMDGPGSFCCLFFERALLSFSSVLAGYGKMGIDMIGICPVIMGRAWNGVLGQ